MGRRIFSEYGFSARGHVLPYDEFVLFSDRGQGQAAGLRLSPAFRAGVIAQAETLVGKAYPPILATDYMMFRRGGDRITLENKYFPRRHDLMVLAVAEYAEGQGRFLDAVIDLLWAILEESTWVLPAHNLVRPGDTGALTYAVGEAYAAEVDYIDLFAAATGADLAFVWYMLKDPLGRVSATIPERILFELKRRILRPVCNRANHDKMFWLGINRAVNNWCPWIVANLLAVAALVEKDLSVREDMVGLCMNALDTFTSMHRPDGGCDEGPSYWSVAGGALFSALEALYDMTGGYVNVYGDELIRNMGEYITKAHICGDRFLNFADAPARLSTTQIWGYEWGERCASPVICDYFRYVLHGKLPVREMDDRLAYRWLHAMALDGVPALPDYRPPRFSWMEDLSIATSRQADAEGRTLPAGQGLFLAYKGGHNGEGHNHNDVGNIVLFSDGQPVFLDAGSGTYTRRTFSPHRYEIWAMCSDYHNTATFNRHTQPDGGGARARAPVYDPDSGSLSMDLTAAYRPEAGLDRWVRTAALDGARAVVTDEVTLRATSAAGEVTFTYMTDKAPEKVGKGYFFLHDCLVRFDPTLICHVEAVEHDQPETVDIPRRWGVETLWRISLTDPGGPTGAARTYLLTVEKKATADPDGSIYAKRPDCAPYLGQRVTMSVDRPIGYTHEKNGHRFTYPINYGYVAGAFGGDDEELDVYLLGVDDVVEGYTGRVVGVVHRTDDMEDKLVMAPEGVSVTKEDIRRAVDFQERYHESWIEIAK